MLTCEDSIIEVPEIEIEIISTEANDIHLPNV